MAILHKNISAEGDIHNPKWFSGANNGDVAWRNELGVLESTDELVLPAALDFVDGSAAPPTSNSGDIYVLSSGASVNAGWGTVALSDWVRYDGTTWNDITPQKSTLCYNETLDKLFSYDGSLWTGLGGDSVYTTSATAFTDVEVTIDNTFSFLSGGLKAYGSGTAGTSVYSIWNGDGTPVKLWDFLDNGDVVAHQNANFKGVNGSAFQLSFCRPVNIVNYGAGFSMDLLNSSGNQVSYGKIFSTIVSGTTGSEYGYVSISAMKNGTPTIISNFDSVDGLTINDVTSTNLFKAGNILTVSKTDVTAEGGYIPLNAYRNVGANHYGVGFEFNLNNSSGNKTAYGLINSVIVDSTSGSEDGKMNLQVKENGSLTTKMTLKTNTVNIPNLPTSATGLVTGDLWNDGGTLKIA